MLYECRTALVTRTLLETGCSRGYRTPAGVSWYDVRLAAVGQNASGFCCRVRRNKILTYIGVYRVRHSLAVDPACCLAFSCQTLRPAAQHAMTGSFRASLAMLKQLSLWATELASSEQSTALLESHLIGQEPLFSYLRGWKIYDVTDIVTDIEIVYNKI